MRIRVKWHRIVVWFIFFGGVGWFFRKDAWWVVGAIVLNDIISFLMDEYEKK